MTSPFLPIANSPVGPGIGTSDVGSQAIKPLSDEGDQGFVAFAEVLGDTQLLQEQEGDDASNSSGEEPVFFQEFHHEELLVSLTGQVTPVIPVLGTNPTGSVALTQQSLTSHPILQEQASAVEILSSSQGRVPGTLELPVGIAGPSTQEAGKSGPVAGTVLPLDVAPLPNQVKPLLETAGQQIARVVSQDETARGGGVKVPAFLNGVPGVNPNIPTALASVTGAVSESLLSPQQSTSALDVGGNTAQTSLSALYAQSRLPQLPDEPTALISRAEGEGKTIGLSASSQNAETTFGSSGSGLPFGQHLGNGQGQTFDSSPGSQVPGNQGQLAARAGNFDERLQLLNTAVPHRLQIDVQLSETARMQVDVGVQHRQVFAGVLLDNPVLRSLAAQNIQALEEQLGKADMELEEFNVHGDDQLRNQHPGQEHDEQKGFQGGLSHALKSSSQQTQLDDHRQGGGDRGWHLVA